jgi:hypothetical protein
MLPIKPGQFYLQEMPCSTALPSPDSQVCFLHVACMLVETGSHLTAANPAILLPVWPIFLLVGLHAPNGQY